MFKRFPQNNVVYLSCLVCLNKHFRNKRCLFGIKRTRSAKLLFCLLNCPICFVTIERVQPRKPTPAAKTIARSKTFTTSERVLLWQKIPYAHAIKARKPTAHEHH